MHDDLAALARRHGLSDAALADLSALFEARSASGHTTLGFLLEDDAAELPRPIAQRDAAARYEDLGVIGRGGMGEVRRVRDRELCRVLAMKITHGAAPGNPSALARFVEEAQATAQLEHPGIVPVHDIGAWPDGRVWFTMKEVQGKTLAEVIREVHSRSGDPWGSGASGWNLRRLIGAFHSVCQAVAFAHARGVVHRDLKPANTMVGRYGEVYVLDWGLAKVTGRVELGADGTEPQPVSTGRAADHPTLVGQVAGTPAYMAPEQARGEVERLDARTDVYALGAMLYEILSGRPPYEGTARGVLEQVIAGPPVPVGRTADGSFGFGFFGAAEPLEGPALPDELVKACERAMAREPAERFDSATALADAIQDWLDGSHRRERALSVVAMANAKGPEAVALRARTAALRVEGAALLEGIEPWRPSADKEPGWALQDEADRLERQASLAELEGEQLLHGALSHAPELPEAHAALAVRYRAEHAAAEWAHRDTHQAEALLRQHVAALPGTHPARIDHLRYLRGDGAFSLRTDPEGAEVLLYRYEPEHRRLVPRFLRSLGRTPLREVTLPMGSYLAVLRHPERAEVRYPFALGRGEHWHGLAPGENTPRPVRLPLERELGPDDCHVPAGWFWSGGDTEQPNTLPRTRLWTEAVIFRRFLVTNREYIAFLDALVADGRTEEALQYTPRTRAGTVGERGHLIYGFDGERFSLRPDTEGDLWEPDWPVMMVTWHDAMAYAAWEAARTGLPWRLPGEFEWEKAARGTDGRSYVWGEFIDPSWCCMRDSHRTRILPASVHDYPMDESVYGVRGTGGNAREWCIDAYALSPFEPGEPRAPAPVLAPGANGYRITRGGSCVSSPVYARPTVRGRSDATYRNDDLGFRLVRSAP